MAGSDLRGVARRGVDLPGVALPRVAFVGVEINFPSFLVGVAFADLDDLNERVLALRDDCGGSTAGLADEL